jgi:acetoin utilization protein AcuB
LITIVRVEEVMSRSVITITPEQTLRDAVEMLRSKHIRHLPVVEGDRLIGIVTDRDVKRATPSLLSGVERDEYDRVLDTTKVAQVMTRDPMTVSPETRLRDAVKIFLDRKMGALPVVANGLLVGIITQIDMLRVFYATLAE